MITDTWTSLNPMGATIGPWTLWYLVRREEVVSIMAKAKKPVKKVGKVTKKK